MKRIKKTKKGYSMLELVISLAIIALSTVVMMNFLILSVQVTVKSLARSFVREEVSNSVNLISRDIRNSDKITSINCPTPTDVTSTCEIVLTLDGTQYKWYKCVDNSVTPVAYRICKDTVDAPVTNVFTSSKSVNIDYLDISYGYSGDTGVTNNAAAANVLITISASHSRAALNITNVLRQASASTRNYQF